ncbi:MAG: undecaprenyl-diphosphate phosphatase [Bacteroidales bacterium]|nr:undecaprenyl-diphosphate phosphatase [Bacteroidales bacterium]
MNWIEALLLGLLQGFTEYLPISSSGHLTIASNFVGVTDPEAILPFTVLLHVATVLSTIVILYKEIFWIFKGLFKSPCDEEPVSTKFLGFKLNAQQQYALAIVFSMIPVGIVGLFFKDAVEATFEGLTIVGCCLLLTAALLTFSYYAKPRKKDKISLKDAFIIGISQACAVLPGLSRSGTTIATGLILGNSKQNMAQFSFLMVIPPILGEALLESLDMIKLGVVEAFGGISVSALVIGFFAAFISGCIACKWMISIVRRGKLIYFAYYCLVAGLFTLIYSFI